MLLTMVWLPAINALIGIATAAAVIYPDNHHQITLKPGHPSETVMGFDNISTGLDGMGNTTFWQDDFLFENFQVVNTPVAAKHGLITKRDKRCATSKPNALFGFREGAKWPRMFLKAENPNATFDLVGISMVVLGDTPDYPDSVSLFLNLYNIDPESHELRNSWMCVSYYQKGYRPNHPIRFADHFGRDWGKGVNVMELYAETFQSHMEWKFCIDDLIVKVN